jgi:hypothetical protein
MGSTSALTPILAIIKFYCNPFSEKCKHFFRKMQNFSDGKDQKSQNSFQYFPNQVENRPQQPACGAVHEPDA